MSGTGNHTKMTTLPSHMFLFPKRISFKRLIKKGI